MIPDAAVEAAAQAIHAMWRAPDGVSWEDDTDGQEAYWDEASAALEAAAPHMLAGAWDAGERVGFEESFRDNDPRPTRNPYRPTP